MQWYVFENHFKHLKHKGNIITNVSPISQAFDAGVSNDWVIMDVNSKSVPNNSIAIQEAIDEGNRLGNILQMTFRTPTDVPKKNVSILPKKCEPGNMKLQIRKKRTGTDPQLHFYQDDHNDHIPSVLDRFKSRAMSKYLIK